MAAFMEIYKRQEFFGKRIGDQLILRATVAILYLLFMGIWNYVVAMGFI